MLEISEKERNDCREEIKVEEEEEGGVQHYHEFTAYQCQRFDPAELQVLDLLKGFSN